MATSTTLEPTLWTDAENSTTTEVANSPEWPSGRYAKSRDFAPRAASTKIATRTGDQGFADLYGAFSVKRLFWVCCQFFVRSGKAVLRPIACDQVRGARGRGQGTETLAELGGLPLSVTCVSQRPLFKPGAGFDA